MTVTKAPVKQENTLGGFKIWLVASHPPRVHRQLPAGACLQPQRARFHGCGVNVEHEDERSREEVQSFTSC